jgi:hypothetical protein
MGNHPEKLKELVPFHSWNTKGMHACMHACDACVFRIDCRRAEKGNTESDRNDIRLRSNRFQTRDDAFGVHHRGEHRFRLFSIAGSFIDLALGKTNYSLFLTPKIPEKTFEREML